MNTLTDAQFDEALAHARSTPARIDALVWCCLNAPNAASRAARLNRAQEAMRAHDAAHLITESAALERRLWRIATTRQRDLEDVATPEQLISIVDVRWFLAAVAWTRLTHPDEDADFMLARHCLYLGWEEVPGRPEVSWPMRPNNAYGPLLGTDGLEPWPGIEPALVSPEYAQTWHASYLDAGTAYSDYTITMHNDDPEMFGERSPQYDEVDDDWE